jgi:hypothetical protein
LLFNNSIVSFIVRVEYGVTDVGRLSFEQDENTIREEREHNNIAQIII